MYLQRSGKTLKSIFRLTGLVLIQLMTLLATAMISFAYADGTTNNTINPTAYGFEAGAGFKPQSLSIVITSLALLVVFSWSAWAFLGVTLESIRNGAWGIWFTMLMFLIVITSLLSAMLL